MRPPPPPGCVASPALLVAGAPSPEALPFVRQHLTIDGAPPRCADLPLEAPCPPGCNCARALHLQSRRVNPWSHSERMIYADTFLLHPKDFGRIAQRLDFPLFRIMLSSGARAVAGSPSVIEILPPFRLELLALGSRLRV